MKKNLYDYSATEDLDLKLAIFIMQSKTWENGCCYHSAVDTFLRQKLCIAKHYHRTPLRLQQLHPAVASFSANIAEARAMDHSWLPGRHFPAGHKCRGGNRGIVPVRARTSNCANTALGKASNQRERHGRCPSDAGMVCQNNAQVLAHIRQFDLSPV